MTEEAELDLEVKDQAEFDELWAVRALRLVHGERSVQYGHPYDVYSRARVMWMAILNVQLSWEQFCYCLAALKMCRELNKPGMTEDNNIDIIGYIAVLNRIVLKEAEIASEQSTRADQGPTDEASSVGEQELPPAEEVSTAPGPSGRGRRASTRAPKGRAGNKRPRSRSRKA